MTPDSPTEHPDGIFTIEHFFCPAECGEWIEKTEQLGYQTATIQTKTGRASRLDIRNNARLEWQDAELESSLFRRIEPYLPSIAYWEPVGLDTRWRAYRYEPGQEFRRHRDQAEVRSETERTFYSFLIYLNDVPIGGETVFYAHSEIRSQRVEVARIAPTVGMALLFDHAWWHCGQPVIAGRKYVLRNDVYYRRLL